jgi:hypothetical protein
MRIASIDSARIASLGASRMNVVGASSRSARWCRESSNRTNGRPVQPRTTTHVEGQTEAAEVMIRREIHRAYTAFWCEGHLGDWDGLCGQRVLAGEGYVQSGDHRLCLSCAETEAKRVAAAEKAFARALVEDVAEAIAASVRSADFGPSACLSSMRGEPVEKEIEHPRYGSGTIPVVQALLSENEQLAKLARSQEMITRSLEDEQRRREPIAGNTNSPVMPLGDERTDEEVALLIEGMVEEVAVIGSLCDTLRDRLDCLTRGLDRREDRAGATTRQASPRWPAASPLMPAHCAEGRSSENG